MHPMLSVTVFSVLIAAAWMASCPQEFDMSQCCPNSSSVQPNPGPEGMWYISAATPNFPYQCGVILVEKPDSELLQFHNTAQIQALNGTMYTVTYFWTLVICTLNMPYVQKMLTETPMPTAFVLLYTMDSIVIYRCDEENENRVDTVIYLTRHRVNNTAEVQRTLESYGLENVSVQHLSYVCTL